MSGERIQKILLEKSEYEKACRDIKTAPEIAIMFCISPRGNLDYPEGHKNFIVRRKNPPGSTEFWSDENLAEVDTFAEAKAYPGAIAYPTAALCTACAQVSRTL